MELVDAKLAALFQDKIEPILFQQRRYQPEVRDIFTRT